MDIVSYNVNGIRAAISKDLLGWMETRNADVYCFQETKAEKSQVDLTAFELLGYNSYWFSAQKKGYSGVAIFTKLKPKNVVYGFGNETYDTEGRIIQIDFDDVSVISVYIPSGTTGDVRQDYKMQWLDMFTQHITKVAKTQPNLVVCGDYNICHQAIDIHDPVGNKNSSGFLPEEREWLTQFIATGFTDSFRHFNKAAHHYSWWTYRANARANNKGWRIDYCMTNAPLNNRLVDAGIHPDVVHSDHCPVWVKLK
ncbi:MAG: exodeoxyribonuclease III [Bacteroidia bacterium]|nr:exodeoxyribonuclease III [Bacteroidia bacterium]MBP9688844.1 exodeoxyribonuclease III [Bacteroidia bacterium]